MSTPESVTGARAVPSVIAWFLYVPDCGDGIAIQWLLTDSDEGRDCPYCAWSGQGGLCPGMGVHAVEERDRRERDENTTLRIGHMSCAAHLDHRQLGALIERRFRPE